MKAIVGADGKVQIPDGWTELAPDDVVQRGDRFFYRPSGNWCEHGDVRTSLRTVRQFGLQYIRSNGKGEPLAHAGDNQ